MSKNDYIETHGRIRYIEPTNLFSDKNRNVSARGDGTLSDAINHPYDDYSMAIDLTVLISNRYSCGLPEETGEQKKLIFSSTKGNISFLGGSEIGGKQKYLTTNYTDISMTNPEENTNECLGIESINISYNSWQYPTVAIKFIDVRGATVMQPSENGYYNSENSIKQLYKAFFTFPYPIFILRVKGFYGKGVSYRLAVQQTNIEFDASSGNFVITANFVGYMFGVYADLPMTFIGISPYTTYGKDYWKSKVDDGTFTFKDENGNYQCDMLKIPELKEKISLAALNEECTSTAAEGQTIQNNYDAQMQEIDGLIENYPFKDYLETDEYLYKVIFPSETTEKSVKNAVIGEFEKIYSYIDSISGYSQTNKKYYINYFKEIISNEYFEKQKDNDAVKASKDAPIVFFTYNSNNNRYSQITNTENEINYLKYIKGKDTVEKYINQQSNDKITPFGVLILTKREKNIYSNLIVSGLIEDKKVISINKVKSEAEYKNKVESIVEKIIGFRPSIKNIYNLIFAHIDTFMHCFYGRMSVIREQLENSDAQRKKTTYNLGDGDTDTPNAVDGTYFDLLPPFPAFYNQNNMGNIENVWAEDRLYGNNGDFIEVEYVKELLNGSRLYSEISENIEEIINSNSNSGVSQSHSYAIQNRPTTNVGNFIPLTTYDFVNKDRIVNPYSVIKDKVMAGENGLSGEILGLFALRAFYYLSTNKENYNNNDESRSFGILEALNFYKAVGDNVSTQFVNFVQKYADNKNNKKDAGEFIELITTRNLTEHTDGEWLFNGNGSNPMFMEDNGLKFTLHSGTVSEEKVNILPLYPKSFNKLKEEYGDIAENLITNRDYITTTNFHLMSGNTEDKLGGYPLKGGTFIVFEDGNFINQIYNNIDNEVETSKEILRATRKNYGERSNTEYGKIKNIGKTLKNYKDNIENKIQGSFFENGVFDNINGGDGNTKIKKIILEGTQSEQEKVYIQRPLGKKNFLGEIKFNDSIFSKEDYLNGDILYKAYKFLMNLPLKNNKIEKISENGITLKVNLLIEGAWYWALRDERFREKRKEIIKDFVAPRNLTYSRFNYLIDYFKNWATDTNEYYGFAANEKRLTNPNLYEKNNKKEVLMKLNYSLAEDGKIGQDAQDARNLQTFLRNLLMQVCTTFDYYNGVYNTHDDILFINSKDDVEIDKGIESFVCTVDSMTNAFKGFIDELHCIYGDFVKDVKKNNDTIIQMYSKEASDPFKNKDLKLSVYMTLKSLYDKWLCNPYKDPNILWSLEDYRSDFQNFIYIDSFYNKIGDKITVNITKISEWLSNCIPSSNLNTGEGELLYTGRTVYEFLTEVAQSCGGTLMALPQKFGLNTEEHIKDMFRPIPIEEISEWDNDESCFVFMYTYKLSEHLGEGETEASKCDMNGYSPKGDGFNLTNEDILGTSLNIESDKSYQIPAFGVTYAKQNQSFFKNISLNSEGAGTTEAGLAATFNIASKGSESPRETTLFGQDLYRVYSNYAYNCNVEMMGNMQVMPLMYFQLNNIPMWKGAYMIKKVTHNIVAGNITTNFEGVRLNKYAIPFAECTAIVERKTGTENSNNRNGELLATGNVKGDALTNYNGKRNHLISEYDVIDFNENNVSPTKPIICLVAGHGPQTEKRQEWACMYKMVNKLAEKLKKEKYYDGTPYNVQVCNKAYNDEKNAYHTGRDGYNTTEIQNIVKKFGSNNVISVACHWNGGAGQYHGVYLNRLDRGVREDSKVFAEYMRGAFENIKKDADIYSSGSDDERMPNGMMDGECEIRNLAMNNSDGGPNQNCACVLTENWFADYGCKGTTARWDVGKRGDKLTGRRWLTSEEPNGGINIISEAHKNGIKRYIDSLKDNLTLS